MPLKTRITLDYIPFQKQQWVKRLPALGAIAALGISLSGCTLCCPPFMDDYATVGGKWARANPTEGRVGSAFSDPGVVHASHDSTMSDSILANETYGSVPTRLPARGEIANDFESYDDAPFDGDVHQEDAPTDSIIILE